MLLQHTTNQITQFLANLSAADAIMIDDNSFIITVKAKWIDKPNPLSEKIEDHEIVFETDFHRFTWWEVANETTELNNQQWQIGENTIAFLRLVPL